MTERQELNAVQMSAGATLITVTEKDVPATFGNDEVAIAAARSNVAVCDRSHWGLIEVSDGDRLRFLHNQSTNDFLSLKSGQGCDTVFVTSTARTIDLVTAYVLDEAVLLLTHPLSRQRLMEWMDRFIFFADKVQLRDLRDRQAVFSLLGANSDAIAQKLGATSLIGQPQHSHQVVQMQGHDIRIAVGSGLAIPGYTLIVDAAAAPDVWAQLMDWDAVPMGEHAWEQLRIEQGRPVPGQELTDDYNPLEAGLWHTISFTKGCYIGQETIARLDTYKGVKQQLWGIKLDVPVEPGTPVLDDAQTKIGQITSVTTTPQGMVGLTYIRTKAGGAGLTVHVGEQSGTLIDVPFLTRQRFDQTGG
jgi:folate-binding protein YgfZ